MVVEWLFCGGDGLESDEEKRRRLGGNTLGKHIIYQDCKGGAEPLFHNYFMEDPVFDDATF